MQFHYKIGWNFRSQILNVLKFAVISALFIIKKMPCPLLAPCPFQILAGAL